MGLPLLKWLLSPLLYKYAASVSVRQFLIRNASVRVQTKTETYPPSYWQDAADGEWEVGTLDFIDVLAETPRTCLIDVGAASGIVTLYALAKGVPVLAIEPSPADFRALEANVLSRSSRDPVAEVTWGVVGDYEGDMPYEISGDPGLLSAITFREGAQDPSLRVPVKTIRGLLEQVRSLTRAERVGIKMDIEGAEFRVLDRDSLMALSNAEAILLLSIHPGSGAVLRTSAPAKAVWRIRALAQTVGLVWRLQRHSSVRASVHSEKDLSIVDTIRRLDGPDKTLVCRFRSH